MRNFAPSAYNSGLASVWQMIKIQQLYFLWTFVLNLNSRTFYPTPNAKPRPVSGKHFALLNINKLSTKRMKYFGLIILLANFSSCHVLQNISDKKLEQQVLKDTSWLWNFYGFTASSFMESSSPIFIICDSLIKLPPTIYRKKLNKYSITLNNYPLDVNFVFPKALVLSRNNLFTRKSKVIFSGLVDSLQQKRISQLELQNYKRIGNQLYILSR